MNITRFFCFFCIFFPLWGMSQNVRVATFNVSLYREQAGQLLEDLKTGNHLQIKNLAEIIQRVRPDIILLNEFDYVEDEKAIRLFKEKYLQVKQNDAAAIEYPYHFVAPSNTGIPSDFDLDNNGIKSKTGEDALGYGIYPGQYAMALLSRYPIDTQEIRTFQKFLWKDMPGALLPKHNGKPWYSPEELEIFRLSSKSHWDVPVNIGGKKIHVLASHPTPPGFDGEEDYNGKRNHDEIRFWIDYLHNKQYIYDDKGKTGGFGQNKRFVILGDLNACVNEKEAIKSAIGNLLSDSLVNAKLIPKSRGGRENAYYNHLAAFHTASWKLRADYVLPSTWGFKVVDGAVFWPSKNNKLYRLVENSSDHFLVYLDLIISE